MFSRLQSHVILSAGPPKAISVSYMPSSGMSVPNPIVLGNPTDKKNLSSDELTGHETGQQ